MIATLAALALAVQPQAVSAAEVPAYTRIDTISQYVMTGAACPQLGYTVSPEFSEILSRRAVSEAVALGVDEATVNRWSGEVIGRQGRLFQQDLSRTLAGIQGGEDPARLLSGLFDRHEALCQKAAADPITVGILTAGSAAERAEARQKAFDDLLKGFGKASWQTPKVVAQGELLMALGMCKSQLPAAEHDRLVGTHLPPPSQTDPASQWLSGQYVDGLQSAPEMGFDQAQCRRLMRTRLAAAE